MRLLPTTVGAAALALPGTGTGRRSRRATRCPYGRPGRRGPAAGRDRSGGAPATAVRLGPRRVPHGRSARARGELHTALDPVQARHHRPLVAVRGGQQHARADQLQLETGRLGAAHLGEPLVDDVGGAAQLGGAEGPRLRLHPLDDVGGGVDEPLLRRVGHGGEDHQVAQALQQVGDEAPRVVAALDDPVHDPEGGRAVPCDERLDDGVEQRAVRVAEQGGRHVVRHTVRAGAREELVHDGHRVTDGPRAGPDDQRQHPVRDRDLLLAADLGEVVAQGAGRHEAEGVVVGARADGPDDLLGLGRREDELEVLRGLLDHLQQGVEALRGDHVGLVDDVDLVPAPGGPEEGLLAQVAGVVHASVRGGVDLDDVDGPRPVPREVLAGLALAAGGRGGALLAVQAAGQDPGAGRLAASARTAEQVRVIDPVVPQRLLQRVGDMPLPDDLGEGLRAVTAVERERRHAYEVIGVH